MRFRVVYYADINTQENEDIIIAREEAQMIAEEKAREIGANVDSVDLVEDIIKGIIEGGKNGER